MSEHEKINENECVSLRHQIKNKNKKNFKYLSFINPLSTYVIKLIVIDKFSDKLWTFNVTHITLNTIR